MEWEDIEKMMAATKCKRCRKYWTCRSQCDAQYNGCEYYEPKWQDKKQEPEA